MTRECHVRFCERLGVKLPGATLPGVTVTAYKRPIPDLNGAHKLIPGRPHRKSVHPLRRIAQEYNGAHG